MSDFITTNRAFRFNVSITKTAGDIDKEFYVEGYAATTDLDRQGDIILKGALQGALDKLLEDGDTAFFGHTYDLSNSVGKITEATVDEHGLYVKIYVSKWAQELRTKLKEKIISKFSIGGRILGEHNISREQAIEQGLMKEEDIFPEIKIIEKMELFEVSFVGVPANPKAKAVGTFMKALRELYTEEDKMDKGGTSMKEKEKKEISEVIEVSKEEEKENVKTSEVEKEPKIEEGKEINTPEEEPKVSKEEDVDPSNKVQEEIVEEPKVEASEEVKAEVEASEEVKVDKEEISVEAIQELVEEVEKEKEEEPSYFSTEQGKVTKEAFDSISKQLESVTEGIKELKELIESKVKVIEVHSEKKSIIKTETQPKPEVVKVETTPDQKFFNFVTKKKK